MGEQYVDQTILSGHHDRAGDIAKIASLGIKKLRYPVVWERIAAGDLANADWRWTDERLNLIREAGIEPIVTLLHHGSGPRYTSLMDPAFPRHFAAFARAVAQRYPWLKYFTPVNEPLTTARFCGLYGVWYPHAQDDRAFLTALRNELVATANAMREIRAVIPGAQLVQTEDLGHCAGTPELSDQIALENERRFASYDLLCGRVDPESGFFQWAAKHGLSLRRADLDTMYCPPDIIGLNYYITSERFLDHRVHAYPDVPVGGNGRMRYIDVEAVRVHDHEMRGVGELALEAWERYRRPIAITESHLGDCHDEQLRWLHEGYSDALALEKNGVDVRGFTIWSLLGAYDWNSLLTRSAGFYESGAFEVRDGDIHETPIAQWIRDICKDGKCGHTALESKGWWRTSERVRYAPSHAIETASDLPSAS